MQKKQPIWDKIKYKIRTFLKNQIDTCSRLSNLVKSLIKLDSLDSGKMTINFGEEALKLRLI